MAGIKLALKSARTSKHKQAAEGPVADQKHGLHKRAVAVESLEKEVSTGTDTGTAARGFLPLL